MEFEIEQAKLLSALSLANTVADRRSTMPVLANVLLRATSDGQVVCAATDMLIAMTERMPANVHAPGTLSLGVRHFHGIVKMLPDGMLRISSLDNHWARIVSGRSEFKLMGAPESDFPELPDPRGGKFVTVPGHVLADLIAKTHFSISNDETRMNLNGVLFESDGIAATMVSTDGHRLTKYTRPLASFKLDHGIIIPRKGVLELRRVLERVVGDCGLLVKDSHLFVQAEQLVVSIKLSNVTFPPYRQVIPGQRKGRGTVLRSELADALRRAEIMAPEKTATVRLEIDDGKLALTADNPDLGVAHQELAVEYEGPAFVAGFNARYLLEVLDAIDTPSIYLDFLGELDPCVLRPNDGADYLGVVMPMRI